MVLGVVLSASSFYFVQESRYVISGGGDFFQGYSTSGGFPFKVFIRSKGSCNCPPTYNASEVASFHEFVSNPDFWVDVIFWILIVFVVLILIRYFRSKKTNLSSRSAEGGEGSLNLTSIMFKGFLTRMTRSE